MYTCYLCDISTSIVKSVNPNQCGGLTLLLNQHWKESRLQMSMTVFRRDPHPVLDPKVMFPAGCGPMLVHFVLLYPPSTLQPYKPL